MTNYNIPYAPVQTPAQVAANKKRNKERWAQYDEQYRTAWSETSKRTMQEWWDSLTPEQRAHETAKLQEWWDSKGEAYRKKHGAKAQAWRQDAEKVLAYREKKLKLGHWRPAEIYEEVYYKTMVPERFSGKLYKELVKEYNMPIQTIRHIAIGIRGSYFNLSAEQHENNIKRVTLEYKKLVQDRLEQKEYNKKVKQNKVITDGKSFKGKGALRVPIKWEIISPGKGAEDLYDYYNNLRTSNQKMPVSPSLVYYFRENNFTAKQIKEYCYTNNIYKGNDQSYWHKLRKFNFPWYSNSEAKFYEFDKTTDAAKWLSEYFQDPKMIPQWLNGINGLGTHGKTKGWIIRKNPVLHEL